MTVSGERFGWAAVELAGIAGVVLDDWQVDCLVRSMLVDERDEWVFPLVCIAISRQDGKGEILQARELFGAIKLQETVLHTAQVLATSKDAFKRAHRTVVSSDLDAYLTNDRWANGEESLEFGSDVQAINYRARSGKAGRGLTQVDFIAYDEAQHLTEEHTAASSPTQLVAEHPQTFALGSGGLRSSGKWWEWRVAGLVAADAGRGEPMTGLIVGEIPGEMLWLEYTAEIITVRGGALDCVQPDIDDEEAHARANPAYPHRLTPDGLRKMRRELGDAGFMRECMGVWDPLPNLGGSQQTKVTVEDWERGEDYDSVIVSGLVYCVAVGVGGAVSSVAAAGRRADGRRHTELLEQRAGVDWLDAFVSERISKNRPVKLAFLGFGDSAQVAATMKRLAKAPGPKIEVEVLTLSRFAAACDAFAAAVKDGGSVNRPRDGRRVLSALKAAKVKAYSDTGWVWVPQEDSAALEAVTGADWVAESVPARRSAYEQGGMVTV